MYIYERIISIAIYLIINFIIAICISKTNDNYRKIKKIFIIYVICVTVLSYFYIPAETADLTRLRIYVKNTYIGMQFKDYLEILKSTSTFTTHTFYYLVAKTGIKELLSVISCIINYAIMCHIIYDYSKNHNIKCHSVANALILYISIGELLEVISGLRTMCAFSIFLLCIYREFFKEKRIISNIFLYLLAIGFHNAIVPIVIIRFIFLIIQKEDKLINKLVNYIMLILIIAFTFKYGNTIIEATAMKAQIYLSNDIFSYFWTKLSTILTIITVIYVYMCNKKLIKQKIPKNYRLFFLIILSIDIVFCFIEYSIFRRYSRIVVMLFIPIVLECFNYKKNKDRLVIKKNNVIYYILLYTILFIEISRGDLCGIRYFTFIK